MENDKKQQQPEDDKNEKHAHKSGNAANIDSIISSPTENVRSMRSHHDSLANTGTNISYEGPTAAGGGGSAGTGYTSGQDGTGASITTESDTAYVHGGSHDNPATEESSNKEDAQNVRSGEKDQANEDETAGIP